MTEEEKQQKFREVWQDIHSYAVMRLKSEDIFDISPYAIIAYYNKEGMPDFNLTYTCLNRDELISMINFTSQNIVETDAQLEQVGEAKDYKLH